MGLIVPAALALLALAIPIVLLYLLRLRREEQPVASIYLWQQAVRDLEVNTPWQRLRRNLLLFLQLAALVALVLALGRPYLSTSHLQGGELIVVLDTSASMAATDLSPNRLGVARRQVRQLAGSLPPGGPVTLITAGGTPRILLSHSSDRALLEEALERLPSPAGRSDLTPALQLAAALAAEAADAEVVLLSDGQAYLADGLVIPAPVRFLPLGESDANQGIVACALDEIAGRLHLFVRVHNFALTPARRRLEIYVGGQLLTARHLDLPPGGDASLSLELEGPAAPVEARLDGAGDDLPLDDVAWALPAQGGPGTIVLVTAGNRFLQTALGLLPEARLTVLPPDAFAEWWAVDSQEGRPADLFILDGYLPDELPPAGLFLIAPPTSTHLFRVEGTLDAPRPRPARPDDPLLRYVDTSDLVVREARRIALPAWARPVLTDEAGHPLLLIGEAEGRPVAVLAFDLHDSDLPLRAAFPLLMSNLYQALRPAGPQALPVAHPLGEPLLIPVLPESDAVVVTTPAGREMRLHPDGSRVVWEDTAQPGIYTVSWWREGRELARSATAVSLLSPQEGQISPRRDLTIATTAGNEERGPAGRLPLERWLAGVALLLLLVEWGAAYPGGVAELGRLRRYLPRLRRRPRSAGGSRP